MGTHGRKPGLRITDLNFPILDEPACAGWSTNPEALHPDAWFPAGPADHPEALTAATICANCPITTFTDCHAYATQHRPSAGIWAGTFYGYRPPHTGPLARNAWTRGRNLLTVPPPNRRTPRTRDALYDPPIHN